VEQTLRGDGGGGGGGGRDGRVAGVIIRALSLPFTRNLFAAQ